MRVRLFKAGFAGEGLETGSHQQKQTRKFIPPKEGRSQVTPITGAARRGKGEIVAKRNIQKSTDCEFMLTVHQETPRAYLLSSTGKKKDAKWFPKTQAQVKEKHLCTFTIPEWVATQKGMF